MLGGTENEQAFDVAFTLGGEVLVLLSTSDTLADTPIVQSDATNPGADVALAWYADPG